MEAYVLIQTEVGKASSASKQITEIPGVRASAPVSGPYDVIALAEGHSLDQLSREIVLRIQEVDGIIRTVTCPFVYL